MAGRDLVVRFVGDTKPLEASTPVVQSQLTKSATAAEKMARRFEQAAARAGRSSGSVGQKLLGGIVRAAASQVVNRAGEAIGNKIYDKVSAKVGQSSLFTRFNANATRAGTVAGQRVATQVERQASKINWDRLKSPKIAIAAVGIGLLFGRRFARSASKEAAAGFKPDGLLKKAAGLGKAGVAGLAVGAGALAVGAGRGILGLIDKAGQAEQSIGAVAATFGKYANQVQADSRRAAAAVGVSADAYRILASTTGSLLKNKGIKDYAGATKSLIALGADLSAQFGGSTKDAVEALNSALRGETDPIERYGVSMNQAAIAAEAMSAGLVKPTKNVEEIRIKQIRATLAQKNYNEAVREHGRSSSEALTAEARLGSAQGILEKAMRGTTPALTDQQKAMAALSLVNKQTAAAQGSFAREQDTYAHKVQVAAARWEDLKVAMGNKFLPIATKVMGFVSDTAIPKIAKWVGNTKGLGPVLGQAGKVLQSFGKIVGVAFGGAASQSLNTFKQGLTGMLDYLTTHQADIVRGFVTGADTVLQFGEALVGLQITGLRAFGSLASGFADFIDSSTTGVGAFLHANALAFGWIPGVGDQLKFADQQFSSFRKNATTGLRSAGTAAEGAAKAIEDNVVPALSRTRNRLREVGEQEVGKAAQRDSAMRLANAINAIGTNAQGGQIRLKKWADVSTLGAKAQRDLRGRINAAQRALGDQVEASRRAGDGQKALTKTWERGRDKLYAEFKQMGLSKREAGKLADKYAGIKPKVSTKVEQPGMRSAISQTKSLGRQIGDIPNRKNVKINFSTSATFSSTAGNKFKVNLTTPSGVGRTADGGTIARGPGRGGPREDKVLGIDPATGAPTTWISPDEEVVKARSAGPNRQVLKTINAGNGRRFEVRPVDRNADGGTVNRRIITRTEANLDPLARVVTAVDQGVNRWAVQEAGRIKGQLSKQFDELAPRGGGVQKIDMSNPRGHTSFRGHTFSNLFAANLLRAEKAAGATLQIYQGGFRPRTSYSGTSHQGDAIDARVNRALLKAMRARGIPTWDRTGKGNWVSHMHGIPLPGAGYPAGSAVWQGQDYLRGGDGLKNGGTVRSLIRDGGGPLPPGPSVVHNNTGRTEGVVPPDVWQAILAGGGTGGRDVRVEVVPDSRGIEQLVRVVVREELRKVPA